MVTHLARVRINRVRLPILLVVSWNRDTDCWSHEICSAVPSRVSLFISILRLNIVLTYGIPPEFRALWIFYRNQMMCINSIKLSARFALFVWTCINTSVETATNSSTAVCLSRKDNVISSGWAVHIYSYVVRDISWFEMTYTSVRTWISPVVQLFFFPITMV